MREQKDKLILRMALEQKKKMAEGKKVQMLFCQCPKLLSENKPQNLGLFLKVVYFWKFLVYFSNL